MKCLLTDPTREPDLLKTGVSAWWCLLLATTLAPAAAAGAALPAGLEATPLRAPVPATGPRFTLLSPAETGVVTTNDYADPQMWGARYHEFEIGELGTGVAIADYDGDGRPDLFVVSKTESCRLFRNLGDYRFEDVTAKAGVGDAGAAAAVWKQGATFADINNDGRPDLYVCRGGAPNLLYINQGDGTFREEAHLRGLDLVTASGMGAFCDYDRDGRLDVYVHTNLLDYAAHPDGEAGHLFHQNPDGTFTDVTAAAGLGGVGQAHAALWWDFDGDGWPDLYVSNDFAAPNRLYRNNRDGTFTDVIDATVPHMPYSSMGADLGDVNNDGRLDLLVADMAATGHAIDQRTMALARSQAVDPPAGSPVAPQTYRNALYLATGSGRCLEAACLAGIAATDWTWSVRLEDLDNDGRVDLFVTNGMHREVNNADLLQRQMRAESSAERVRIMRNSPVLAQRNLAFRNLGDLNFADVSREWGLDQRGVSFGVACGDLNGDGNLDLVYTNYQGGVSILRNNSAGAHRVTVSLRGSRSNAGGVGAVVRVFTAAGEQVRTLTLERGYLSSSEPILHFGLGAASRLERLVVDWPGGAHQVFTDLAADYHFTITEPASAVATTPAATAAPGQFVPMGGAEGFSPAAAEAPVDEAALQPLMPFRFNRRGPAVAVGDVDGDGADEIVLGGTTLAPARLWHRTGLDGRSSWIATQTFGPGPVNDGPVLLLDTTGTGRLDLLIARGGNSLPDGAPEYQPVLYLNDGHGIFRAAPPERWPDLPIDAGAMPAADFARSGRVGVFIGGRLSPGQYPESPRSALLLNRDGAFVDVTDTVAPALRRIGLVTAAMWSDVDGDGWPDLLVACEWGQVKCFRNVQGLRFDDWTNRLGFDAAGPGWWTALASADFNGDGRPDFVAGNAGLNTPYRAGPVYLFYGDFNGRGEQPQLIEAYTEGEKLYPWRGRLELGDVIPDVLRKFPSNNAYAAATLPQIIGPALGGARRFAVTQMQSGVFLSQADGRYLFRALPRLVQIAPLQGIAAGDFDGDGHADVYAVENSFAPAPGVGRFDGGLSQLLRGDGAGNFTPVDLTESGLVVPGDAKGLAVVDLDRDGWPDFIVTRNAAPALAFRNRGVPGRRMLAVRLVGPPGNPTAVGACATLERADGTRQRFEVTAGGGFSSQSSATCFFAGGAAAARRLVVIWPDGRTTAQDAPAGLASEWIVQESAADSPR